MAIDLKFCNCRLEKAGTALPLTCSVCGTGGDCRDPQFKGRLSPTSDVLDRMRDCGCTRCAGLHGAAMIEITRLREALANMEDRLAKRVMDAATRRNDDA